MFGNPIPFNDAGRKVMARRLKSLKDGMSFRIFQSKDRLEVLFDEYRGLLTISLDAAKPPPAGYMGRSVAHWDGDTLVVETTGYKEGIWLDVNGSPASKNAKMTQRIRKVKSITGIQPLAQL
jgi:hypothetical protein